VLTPAAHDVVAQFAEIDQRLRVEFRAGLSRSEREVLADLLLRMERNAAVASENSLVDSDS
jgi:hypothetical protein